MRKRKLFKDSQAEIISNYMAKIGKLGGKAKSERKASTSRLNGFLGGRPKKEHEK